VEGGDLFLLFRGKKRKERSSITLLLLCIEIVKGKKRGGNHPEQAFRLIKIRGEGGGEERGERGPDGDDLFAVGGGKKLSSGVERGGGVSFFPRERRGGGGGSKRFIPEQDIW